MKLRSRYLTKAIILAAGMSKRMRLNIPKYLLKLNMYTICDYQIRSLIDCGIGRTFVVVGYKKEMIINYVIKKYNNIGIIVNNLYKETDNAFSLALALQMIDLHEPVIVLDGDIIFDVRLLRKLSDLRGSALVADNVSKTEIEDCKVLTRNGYAISIGKRTNGTSIYTSMIKLSGNFLEKFKIEVEKPKYRATWYSVPLNELLMRFPKAVRVTFTNGLFRLDVDTPEDLILAKKIIRELES